MPVKGLSHLVLSDIFPVWSCFLVKLGFGGQVDVGLAVGKELALCGVWVSLLYCALLLSCRTAVKCVP